MRMELNECRKIGTCTFGSCFLDFPSRLLQPSNCTDPEWPFFCDVIKCSFSDCFTNREWMFPGGKALNENQMAGLTPPRIPDSREGRRSSSCFSASRGAARCDGPLLQYPVICRPFDL